MMNTKTLLTALTATAALSAGSATAAIINVPDYTVSGLGAVNTTSEQLTDVATPNGGNVLPASGTQLAYWIGTYNFGAGSDVHITAHFVASLNVQQDRVGVTIDDDGLVSSFAIGPQQANSTFDLAQDMAGQSVNVLVKLDYDINRSTINANDTLMEVWINPTSTSTEGAADMSAVWNSASFPGFIQRIDNQNTPDTAGDSSITNVQIFTGSDATFENALAAIPEPSSLALLGLGGLLIARRRRD